MRETLIAVGFLISEDRVLLGRRAASMRLFPCKWDAIGGHVEVGESPESAVRREVQEELGVSPEVCELLGRFATPHPHGDGQLSFWVFGIREWSGGQPRALNAEHSRVEWFTVPEALAQDLSHSAYRGLLGELATGAEFAV